jgi:protein TonB
VTTPAACRLYLSVGFLVSALLHLGVAAALLWPEPTGMEGSGEGRLVGVSLAMFQTASEAQAAEAATEPTAEDQPEPEAAEEPVEPETQPQQQAAEVPDAPPPEPEPAPEPTVAEEPEPTPQPEAERAPEAPPQKKTEAAVAQTPPPPPVPKPKPKSQPKPKAEPKAKPKPRTPAAETAKRPPAAKAAASAQASLPKSSARSGTSAASAAGTGSGKDAAEGRYLAELQAAIAKHRFFPPRARRRGLEGQVTVSFTLEGDGRITGIRVVKGSGSSLLDEGATKTLERLGRFKPIPKAIGRSRWTLRVPIGFTLR